MYKQVLMVRLLLIVTLIFFTVSRYALAVEPVAYEQAQLNAIQGDADAQFALAEMYFADRENKTENYARANEWYKKSAKQGHPMAQLRLAVSLLSDTDVAKDGAQAAKWVKKSANQGLAQAQNLLGVMYLDGHGVEQDLNKGRAWLEKAAEQGCRSAQFSLGTLYSSGEGVPQNYDTARKWFEKSAAQGFSRAQNSLGIIYKNGRGVPQDYKKAYELFEQAAVQGWASGQFNLGLLYEKGEGVPQDYGKALEWYQKSRSNETESNWADGRLNKLYQNEGFLEFLEIPVVSAAQVNKEFDENEIRASMAYRDKPIAIKGRVNDVGFRRSTKRPRIFFKNPSSIKPGMEALFQTKDKNVLNELAALNVGDSIIIVCFGEFRIQISTIVDDCYIGDGIRARLEQYR